MFGSHWVLSKACFKPLPKNIIAKERDLGRHLVRKYTPENRLATDLISDDRPYAGWLYGSLSIHTVTADPNDRTRKVSESVELSLGVVGPESLGEEAQDFIHEARLIDPFRGWDNQLKTEPGILLNYERKWRRRDPIPHGEYFEADFIPRMGASLGNVMTQAGAGGVQCGLVTIYREILGLLD